MSVTDEVLDNTRDRQSRLAIGDLSKLPARKLAIITCMDARIDILALLSLDVGDAHVIRNAGGIVTADAIRSLTISQRELGTREVMLIHHTGCGMMSTTEDTFREQVRLDTGITPDWAVESFTDLDVNVRQSIARIMANPFVPYKESIRGFVFDLNNGGLREVTA